MNSRAFRLPGERDLDPGEPNVKLRQMGGPVTLQSFKFIHEEDKLSWHRDLPRAFTLCLFTQSQVRRINAGPNNLYVEAARATLKLFERPLHRMYAARGWLSYFPDELADELAKQLADELKAEYAVKDDVRKQLRYARDAVPVEEAFEVMPQSIRNVSDIETVEHSFSRWLDYFEYVKINGGYMEVLSSHRFVVACARIHDAVFGTSILHFSRA